LTAFSRTLVLAALVCTCAVARSVSAQTVVLVRPDASDPVLADAFNRLDAELRIHGFDVHLEPAAQAPEALSARAEARAALAALAFVYHGDSPALEIWLIDRVSGQSGLHTIEVPRGADSSSLLAVRAVDLLRASLQEYAVPEEPALAAEYAEPPMAATPTPVTRTRWSLSASGSVLWPGSRFGLAFGPALAVHHAIGDWVQLGVWLSGPLLGTRLETKSGSATVRHGFGWFEARLRLLRAGRFELAPLLGIGGYFLHASGQPNAPLRGQSATVWSALAVAGVHAQLVLFSNVALGLSLRGLAHAPPVGVLVARDGEELSLPTLEGALGLVLAF
jgi:hypothetical protein